ncbi:MBG domain-containing protein [Collinsella aerofaciens]|uniref:MBG domain-containing protein n=1 Tax=Collinsella aerofaciens TaxID=74426 RepID=UPI00232C8A75|nr:MBG domain-containing protein [Collinsella aerofaciens]MDB1855746.1 MBG domain-containing protein [Collinsella aerofaciens]
MREKKMGMRTVLTRILGIATVACALVATPAVASAETQVMPDGVNAEVLSLKQDGTKPVQITEPGSYVLKTAKGEVTPTSGYTIDAPDATRINPVRIYIDGTVYVNSYTNSSVGQNRWLFNIKQGSNIEFIGVNNPIISFHDERGGSQSVSGFLTDRYYDGGYKNASGDISVSLGIGDDSQDLTLWYSSSMEQKVPAISLGNTKGNLSANFSKLMIKDYAGKSGAVAGNAQEYAVPVHFFREGRNTTGGNINPFTATFTDCEFYDTSGDFNGAVSVDGNSSFKMPKDGSAVAKLTATFNNCSFSGHNGENAGVRQTNRSYNSVEASRYFANSSILNTYAVAGVMGVTNATVNLNSCEMNNFHSTRSSSADSTLTVDALNVARSARCNINGGTIERYGARGNTCVVYAAGTLTLNGSPEIASYWKNSHAGDTNYGDKYTEADKATGTAKSLYVPKKKSVDANVPALNIASDFSVRGGYGDNVWISIEETADSNGVKSRVLGTCESNKIEGVVPDGSSENDDNSDKYEVVNLNGDLTFRETIHQHKWKVEADGLGVRASCVGPFRNGECEYGMGEDGKPKKYLTATYKLSMSKATSSQSTELVYDGCPVKIALNKDGAWNLEQMGVTASDEFTWYQCKSQADAEAYKNGTKLKGAPTDAGYYYVVTSFKTASGQTLEGKKSFEISQRHLVKNQSYKFILKDGGKGAGKYAYDGKEHQPVVESAQFKNGAGEWVDLVEGKDYELSARSESGLKQTEPGQYECIVIGKGNFTTDGGTTSVLTLKWEIVDVARFDLEVTGFEGAYDGEKHGITVNVKNDPVPADMKIEYREDGGDWTTDKPTYRNAAEYTTNYRVTASDYLTVTGKATVKITKADQEAPAGLVGNNWTTCRSNDGSISGVTKKMEYRHELSKDYQKITSDDKLTGLAKSGTYYVRFAEDSNHNASADAEVKIEPGPHAVADNAAWKPNGEGSHVKVCKYCNKTQERQPCRWKYEIVTPATPEADGVRQKVCRVCGGKWDEERYTYVDTYAPTIYDLWVDKAYCESVSFDVFDDRDETVTVTDSGKELKAGKDGRYTVKAAEGDAGTEHVIVATDTAGNKETITIKMYAEHAYEWTIDKQPTVTETGSKHGKCSVCGHESGAVEIPALAVKGYSGKYDGKDHSVDASALPEGSVVEYKAADGGWTSVAPSIKDVGSVTVDYRVTIDGAAVEGQVTLEVTPLAITVSALDASKTYGDSDPALGWEVTKGKLVKDESLQGITVSRELGEAVRKDGYAVTVAQSEGANPNYKITFKDGTFTIGKRELAVTWDTTTEFTYDGEEHCPQAKLHNVVGDDNISAYVEGAKVKAGTYTAKITELTGDDAGNYKLPAEGLTCEFSIKKAPQGAPKVQATAETVSGKSDGKITGVDAKMEWRAKGSGEYQGVPDGVTEITDRAVGTYEVRYRADSDHDASSATEVTVNAGGKFVVTLPTKQIGYTITANPDELDWHGSTTLTVSIESGYFTDNDSYAVKVNNVVVTPDARGEFTVLNAESDLVVTVEGVRKHEAVNDKWLSDDNTHWHECTCGEKIDESAHTFEWVIDKAPTATEAGSKHQQCTVCGHALPAVEIPVAAIVGYSGEYDGAYHTVDATRLPEGATAQYSTDGKNWSPEAPKIKDVGTLTVSYKVTIDGTTAEGEVALEVKPRAITVTAQDASKTYGEADPVFTWAITSGELVESESLEGLEIEREDNDNVRDGGYALHLTQAKGANSNYNITFVDGVFTINQRLLTVTWGTSEFVYDGKEHCPEATLGNVIGKDDLGATVVGSQVEAGDSYQATLTALTGKAAGNYVLPTEGLTRGFSIKNAAQDAPVIQATAETVSGKRDGKITGVDATMEWRAKDAAEYQAVGKDVTELKDLAAGVYEVRYQAKANHDASPVTEVTVAAGRKLVVALPATQEGYSLTATATELDWHGAATLTMSIDSAYFAGKDYAVKVDGKAVELSDTGTFELKGVEHDVNVTVEGVLKHEPDGTGWAHDVTNHWHVCRCGDIIDKAGHTFEWVVDKPATVEAKGEKHQECTVCDEKGKTEEIAILKPVITDGKGQTMVVDAAKDLSFRSNAPLEFFQKVLVDDKEVAAENYVLTEGSTIVTLKASFLKTLGVGEHKLSVVSATGTAETTFTVAEAAKPAPGQTTTTTTTTTTTSKSKKKASKKTLPQSGDSAYAMAGAVLAAGVAALLLAWAMKRRA